MWVAAAGCVVILLRDSQVSLERLKVAAELVAGADLCCVFVVVSVDRAVHETVLPYV